MSTCTYTAEFEINRPVDEVFPLLSPEGETLWVPGWKYENLSGSPDLHEDYVFLTRDHDHASSEALWIVKRYEPGNHHVQFYKVEPGDKVGVVSVTCKSSGADETRVQVTYSYTGLSEKGNEFVESFTREAYYEFIGEWQCLMQKYFDSLI